MRWGAVLGGAAEGFKETMDWAQQQEARENQLIKDRITRAALSGKSIDQIRQEVPGAADYMAGNRTAGLGSGGGFKGAVNYVKGALGLGGTDTSTPTSSGSVAGAAATGATGIPTPATPNPVMAPTSAGPTGLPVTATPAASAPMAPSGPALVAKAPGAPAPGGALPTGNKVPSQFTPKDVEGSSTMLSAAGYQDPRMEGIISTLMQAGNPELALSMQHDYLASQVSRMQLDTLKVDKGLQTAMVLKSQGNIPAALQAVGQVAASLSGGAATNYTQNKDGSITAMVASQSDPTKFVAGGTFRNGVDPITGEKNNLSAVDNLMTSVAAMRSPEAMIAYRTQHAQLAIQKETADADIMRARAAQTEAGIEASLAPLRKTFLSTQIASAGFDLKMNLAREDVMKTARDPKATPEQKAQAHTWLAQHGSENAEIQSMPGMDGKMMLVEKQGNQLFTFDGKGNKVQMGQDTNDAMSDGYGWEGKVVGGHRYTVAVGNNNGQYEFGIFDKTAGKLVSGQVRYPSAAAARAAIESGTAAGLSTKKGAGMPAPSLSSGPAATYEAPAY